MSLTPTPTPPHPRRWLAAIVLLHLALGLVYDWATPAFEASDEGAHYAVVHWLANGHALPIQDPNGPKTDWAQEGSQPPLYYWLGAALTAWIDTSDYEQVSVRNPLSRVGVPGTMHNVNLYRHSLDARPLRGTALAIKAVRWFSLLLSGVTIYLTFRLARRVFVASDAPALLAAALVAFNPMALFINASVNNDNLLMPLSTAALWLTLHLAQPAATGRAWKAASLGLLLGFAALTKVSGLVLWPVAALGVGWGVLKGEKDKTKTLKRVDAAFLLALVFGAALAVCGWWFWRNHQLYGEWLGLNTMVAIAGRREPAITVWDLIRDEWYGFYLSYWGVFGAFTILPGKWAQYFFHALTLWALWGGAWVLFTGRVRPRPEWVLLALFCLLTLFGVVSWTLQTFASQGRLMFGAIAPLSIFMAAGLRAAIPQRLLPPATSGPGLRTAGPGSWGLGFGIVLLALVAAVIPVADIAPRYRPPPVVRETDLPAEMRAVHAVFGDAIELIGYTADARPRTPGAAQPVTLYWRALKPMNKDYALSMHLLGRSGAEVGKLDTWPGGGNAPTSQWAPGAIFADAYLIPIDTQAAAPSLLRLDLFFWEGDPANALPKASLAGEALSSVKFDVGRVVPEQPPGLAPEIVAGSHFEHGIELLGLQASADGALYLELHWRTANPIAEDYTVFLHLVDAGGVVVTQGDAPPLYGDWPTSAWVPGRAFADVRLIPLPPGLPPGWYGLRLGFYHPASGTRLTALRPDGTHWPDDMVVIENLFEVR